MEKPERSEFAELAEDKPRQSLASEFIEFLRTEKKWWLVPLVLAISVVGLLAWFSGTAAAPFIYTLF